MNKINSLFDNKKNEKLLSLYFCAGCPSLEGTADVILAMQRRGIAMIEVGIPFSDPLADGPVIQSAATQALKNGMNLKTLFGQLAAIKDQVEIPLVLMGYLNPILHYGIEEFCQSCVEAGVSGAIIPDLPFDDYQNIVKPIADKSFDDQKQEYFRRINAMNLRNPRMIGFGISNAQTLKAAQDNAAGAIIGSKFVTLLNEANGNADLALDHLFDALNK